MVRRLRFIQGTTNIPHAMREGIIRHDSQKSSDVVILTFRKIAIAAQRKKHAPSIQTENIVSVTYT